jgi:pseudaminic acid synthase/N,N'-diacetyllegionaminate synthase
MKIEDFESALNPDEFEQFTDIIRNAALAFGTTMNNEDFGMSDSEIGYREMIRRHVVANKDLDAGSIIQPGDLVLKRTSSSHFITDMKLVYHRKLNRSLKHNSAISPTDI